MRFLVVDDEDALLGMMVRIIRRVYPKCKFEIAATILEAESRMEPGDITISDNDLGKSKNAGLRFLQFRKSQGERVGLITGNDQAVKEAEVLGIPVLAKPFDIAQFREFLARVVGDNTGE